MRIELDRSGTAQALREALAGMAAREDVNGLIVLTCDANGFMPEDLDEALKSCSVPLVGGVFPAIIYLQEKIETGSIVIGLAKRPEVVIVSDISNPDTDFVKILDDKLDEKYITDTLLILIDGFSSRISSFINAMFIHLGLESNIIGGGAGSLSLKRRPYILSNEGMLEDAAVISFLDTRSLIRTSHGWTPIKGPFKVTEADRNVIKSLDWMPAFGIYREAIRSHSGKYITKENFSSLAMSYPFGISRMCSEPIVRDPVMVDDEGALVCVGEVVEGSFVDILHGNKDSLVRAMSDISAINGDIDVTDSSAVLMVDCISRALFLEENFQKELQAVHLPDMPLAGFLSFGEIATKEKESVEFHNKTTVLSILEEL